MGGNNVTEVNGSVPLSSLDRITQARQSGRISPEEAVRHLRWAMRQAARLKAARIVARRCLILAFGNWSG